MLQLLVLHWLLKVFSMPEILLATKYMLLTSVDGHLENTNIVTKAIYFIAPYGSVLWHM